ncbi:MAG TPA: GAF domain-containing protein [Candidatus Acidoferrales bacterium]|nr:GAF domain-containing protein [Candidatus Acidoferrales bacterium]
MERLEALYELATTYHSCRDTEGLLKAFSRDLRARLGPQAVLLWLKDGGEKGLRCRERSFAAGERIEPKADGAADGLLTEVLESRGARRLGAAEKKARLLSHLEPAYRDRVQTALYAPIPGSSGPAGVVELLNKAGGEFTPEDGAYVEEAARMTGRALDTIRAADTDRNAQFSTLERLTALYDIARIFNSTLELEDLCPIVTNKIRDILGAQACNLWLVAQDGETLEFAHQDGEDPTTDENAEAAMGEGLVGVVARDGKGRLAADASVEALLDPRRDAVEGYTITSAMAAPLLKDERVLGVVEVLNKLDETPFDDDDLFFLNSVGEQAGLAVHNAKLLEAERKVHQLGALLTLSKEITSTLDLDHILTTLVHQAAEVLPFERCAIGLYDGAKFYVAAVSGESEVPGTPEMKRLREILEWVGSETQAVSADQLDTGWRSTPEKPDPRLIPYLTERQMNGFYATPLRDDQGTLGVIELESGEGEFLSESQLELLEILASQVTVAIRNARLYQNVPLIRVWQPVAETRQKLRSVAGGRGIELLTRAVVVAVLLVAVPWPLRVDGTAQIVPAQRRMVTAESEGIVKQVFVHEGDFVAAGAPLAQLDDGEIRVRLEAARAQLALAHHELAEAEDRRDLTAAGRARLHMEMAQAAVDLESDRLAHSRLVAPIAGQVITPKVEEKAGRLVARGESFCELVDPNQMAADIVFPETDAPLVERGARVSLKVNALPTKTFAGSVDRIETQTTVTEGEQFFKARAVFDNTQGRLRDDMVGRAKIDSSGGWGGGRWRPVGYVLLRPPARWMWRKIWNWLP